MPAEKFDSPILQAAHEINGGWRGVPCYNSTEYIFIEDSFTEEQLLELARAVIAAHDAKKEQP